MGTDGESGVVSRYGTGTVLDYSLKSDQPCISGLGSEWVDRAQLSGVDSLVASCCSVPRTRVCSFIDALRYFFLPETIMSKDDLGRAKISGIGLRR